ncbi:alpha/beta hydrolase [Pseudomonas sp. TH39(2020)]|uniref:alpha/beta fold hydrolase n=1 Tax=Pseudomonas sp. TH39(2020) TaxID=2796349 RepID=UPI0019113388|nr:alpha/beta hydrolase [Pseudomonas sp. TH39(2020)]MBK5395912.1 alpha/beta hydrolase [Pseudomonas sp. TH39(2020)]
MLKSIDAGVLHISFDEAGPTDGWPVILLHGFPYDIHAYSEIIPMLSAAGARVITPYLRGFGPTRFLDEQTPRSGQQAAIAHDLLALMDALNVGSAHLVGYDWGGRAACVVAALWPERVQSLVSIGSYAIQDIASAMKPAKPEDEFPYWYQYYFHSERGRNALIEDRGALCHLLWEQWSPSWQFTEETFEQSAASFENPDFVDVVIHSYRHRFGLVAGDPAYSQTELALAKLPSIGVPTIGVDGGDDGLTRAGTSAHTSHFSGSYLYRKIDGAGHNLPQEMPREVVDLILQLKGRTSGSGS